MSDLTLDRIGQIATNVQDVERATAYYRDVLGMKFLFAAPPGLAFFDCGGVRLMLSRAEDPELDHPASILYYKVADIASAHRTLADRGVTFVSAPHVVHKAADHDLWLADFRDSEGNVLALMCEAPR
jgi:methylmalonyl-CoA/ethylmalonyl-CoA epimerase